MTDGMVELREKIIQCNSWA